MTVGVAVFTFLCLSVVVAAPPRLQNADRRLVASSSTNVASALTQRLQNPARRVASSSVNVVASALPQRPQNSDRRVSSSSVREDVVGPPRPYQFGYELEDGFGMSQYRSEASDGAGVVKGSYGYMDPQGVYRKVEYTADGDGYRAVIRSNEPGTANQNVADALFIVEQPPAAVIKQGLVSDVIQPREATE